MSTTATKRRPKAPAPQTCALDALPLGDEFPPRAVRLFAMGENRTTKGVFVFDDEAARAVMAAFEEHGIDLAMDYDHGALAPADGRKRDVPGYYRPEVRADGLYALPQWTESGLAAIRPGKDDTGAPTLPEYRYTSPSFSYDPDTRRVLKLGPLALTSYPATHGARPLTLSARDRRPAEVVAALAMSFEGITQALARAATAVFGYGVEVDEVYADRVVFETRAPDGRERCMAAPYTVNADGSVTLGDLVEVEEQYVPVDGGMVVTAPKLTPPPAPMVGATQPASMTQESQNMTASSAVLAALGAQDEAAGVAALSALNTTVHNLRAESAALTAATGAKTHSEALAVVEAWKRDAADLATFRAKVAADEAARAKIARDAELDACVREGKLSPGERAEDGKPESWLTALSADAVARFRAARAPVVQVQADPPAVHGTQPKTTPAAALSADDEKALASLAASLNVDINTVRSAVAGA
jgi:phage I-like protein